MNWDDRERYLDQPEFCEREFMSGNTTLYCLFREGHECPCIYADPELIQKLAKRNDQVNPI